MSDSIQVSETAVYDNFGHLVGIQKQVGAEKVFHQIRYQYPAVQSHQVEFQEASAK